MRRYLCLAVAIVSIHAVTGAARAVEVISVTSPGGITAWLVEDHSIPLTAIEFSFRGGAAVDPAGKEGLAGLTSSLIDEGAGDLTSQAFQGILENKSITLRFSAGMDTFRGSVKSLNRDRTEAIRLLRLALTEPRFDDEPVERIRNQILVGLERAKTDPRSLAGETWWRAVFPDHPYGRPSEGTMDSVKAITVADMRQFVRQRFAREQLFVGVVGDITPAELAPLLDEAFGALPASGTAIDVPDAEANATGETIVVSLDTPQSVMVFGQRGVLRSDPDYYAAVVMNHILGGGGFGSRLTEQVREKRGLAYSVFSGLTPLAHVGVMSGRVATENARAGESMDLIRIEWKRMHDEGATETEVEDAIQYLTGSFPLRFDRSDRIARMLVGMQYNDLGIDYFDRRNENIAAVTAADVNRVARRLLDPEGLTVVAVGKPEGLKATRQLDAPGG